MKAEDLKAAPSHEKEARKGALKIKKESMARQPGFSGRRGLPGQIGLLGLIAVLSLGVSLAGCKDTKTLQENQQLKTQVTELQKENGQLGNDVETLTAARDALTKENAALQDEVKRKRPAAKTARKRRARKARQS